MPALYIVAGIAICTPHCAADDEIHHRDWSSDVCSSDLYDSVSDEMGSIYYKGFSEEEITRFEECLDRIRKNLEEWQKS